MSTIPEKHKKIVGAAIGRLIGRASNARGLNDDDLRPRIERAVVKYILEVNAGASAHELREFVDGIHADDICLILACERGDERAWEDLVAQYDSTVRSAARKIAANSEDAEDLASSIWAELYGLRQDSHGERKSKLGYYSGRGSLGGWLRAVVSQLAVDQFRKQAKFVQIEETREFENLAEDASNNANNDGLVSHSDNPEHIFSKKQAGKDVAKALMKAVDSLGAEDRLIVKMYYFDDLKLKDLAATFGYHEATASRRLSRLHNDIRKAVERNLREQHGWSDGEIKRTLAETAEHLGLSVEKLFAVLIFAVLLQDLIASGVQ
jgi:RNA polymerase sigma-70 factor (ECF subfamily)